MQYLRQSTASQEISLGYFLDSTDGDTEESGLTIANTDIKLRKGGTTTLANKNSGGATIISNGIYSAVLDATDSDTLGMMEIYCHVAGALATKTAYMVLPAASFDALITNGLNDIAATAIVSGGAIDTTSGAIDDVTTTANLTANNDKTGYAVTATGLDLVLEDSTFNIANSARTWNEVLTGGTFNIATSSGRRLRQLADTFVVHDGTAQAGTSNTITLDTGASTIDNIYEGDRIVIVAGTGAQEHGIVLSYVGSTRVATMSQNWVITPDATSEFEMTPADVDVESWQHATVANSATTNKPCVDIFSISDDATAANNLELDYDGTGFDKANSNIGTVGSVTTKTGYAVSATGLDLVVAGSDFIQAVADDVWDEVLTGATHNVMNSSGKRLRDLGGFAIRSGTAQGPGTGNNQIQFDTGASAVDGAYDPAGVLLIGGTQDGQSRLILQYDGTTKTATVDRNWKVNPTASTDFVIIANPGREHVNEGLAQAGTSTTITLNTLASAADDTYIGQTVFLRSGTGDDQARLIIDYDGTTKIATIDRVWDVIPDTTSGYVMLPTALRTNQDIVDAVWDELQSGHTIAGSFGKFLDVEVSSVSGGGGLTQQNVRDAMKLTPTVGSPSTDSIDEHLDDIKVKTDKLTFTSGNDLDANIQKVNDVTVTGTGANGNEWGP